MSKETKVLIGLGLLTIILIIGGSILLGNSSTPQSTSSSNSKKVDQKLLIKNDSNKIATSTAKVTLVEFSDFQCPACGAVYPVVKQILEEDKSKVNFVYRHFPLPQHQNARLAAEAAEAAGDQGKFWEMHDKIFENQSAWSENANALDIFMDYAKDLKLDTDKFKKSVQENKFSEKIQGDVNDGNSIGVNSTPTFFLNGQKVQNLQRFSDLKTLIEQEIKK